MNSIVAEIASTNDYLYDFRNSIYNVILLYDALSEARNSQTSDISAIYKQIDVSLEDMKRAIVKVTTTPSSPDGYQKHHNPPRYTCEGDRTHPPS